MARLGVSFSGTDRICDIVANSKLAEQVGFEVVWWGEDFFLRDGISPLASIAVNTTRAKLGTGILSPYVHHPATIATTIATLDEVSNGRMILGLGAGVAHWIKHQMGIDQPRPVLAMRECIQIFNRLIKSETVTFEGEVFKCRGVKLGFDSPRKVIPVYLAATGPRMLELAGEIADGVIPAGAGASPNFTKSCVDRVAIGARKSGRKISDIDIHQFVISSVSDNSENAKDGVREFLAWMIGTGTFTDEVLQLDDFGRDQVQPIIDRVLEGDIKGASRHVSDEMVDTFAAAGSPRQFRDRIREYYQAGANCVVLIPMGSQAGIRATIQEAAKNGMR